MAPHEYYMILPVMGVSAASVYYLAFSTAYEHHNLLNVELALGCPMRFLLIHLVATPINYTSTCHV